MPASPAKRQRTVANEATISNETHSSSKQHGSSCLAVNHANCNHNRAIVLQFCKKKNIILELSLHTTSGQITFYLVGESVGEPVRT